MFSFILSVLIFIVMYFVYYFIYDNKLKQEKYTKISELVLLVKRFKLDKKKMNYKSALNGIAIINAFIISFTIGIIDYIPWKIEIKLLIAFVIIFSLMLSMYFAYGKYLQKKWGEDKNGI